MNYLLPLEDRERLERQRREMRDAGLKAEDSLIDLSFSLERFGVAIMAAQGSEGDHKEK